MSRRPTVAELPVDELAAALACERQAADVRRADELARTTAQAAHDRARADVGVASRLAEMERAEREASAEADTELARMYRSAVAAGERIRIGAGLARSAEARALRLEKLRATNLKVLIPVLAGFAVWSTTGVQAGAAQLMAVDSVEPMWWALWLLEPVLIGAVVWVIIARARLASSGGRLTDAAERIAWGCLGTSVVLNLIAGSTEGGGDVLTMLGAMLAHAIGPVGAAATAHLIGVVDSSIASADPWTERGERVPRLAEMDLRPPAPTALDSAREAVETTTESAVEIEAAPAVTVWPVPVEGRALLPIVARPTASEEPTRTGGDLGERPAPRARRTPRPVTRPNKGARVPAVLKAAPDASPRALSDADLADRLAALVESGEVAADAPVRAVQDALGVGFVRAKRVRALLDESASGEREAA